jgi:signal transduction histidine kinase/CheY-like chemotaxis protein
MMSAETAENRQLVISLLNEAYTARTNNLQKSNRLAKKALTISKQIDDKPLIGKSLNELALFAMIKGEYARSMKLSAEAIKVFEYLNDELGVANAKYNVAGIYYKTDNFHKGLVYLVDCLSIYRKFNDHHNQARTQKSLGTIYEYFNDQKKAIQAYESAIEAAKIVGDLNLESNAYNPLSGIYLKLGKITLATELIERAIAMKKRTGDVRGMAFSIYGRGKIFSVIGEYDKAEKDILEAICIHQEMGERLGLGMAYQKLARLYVTMGKLEKAEKILQIALDLSRDYNMIIIAFKCNYLFYEIYKQLKQPVKALEYLELYLLQKEAVINTQTLKVIENYELITKMDMLEKEAQLQREKAEIIEKKNRAEQAAVVKQEFLSTMSHEIRTPLNAVITVASLLGDKSIGEERKLIESLKFAANSLLLIINDILDFSKLEAGKMRIEPKASNFHGLLNNICDTYRSLADEKGIALNLLINSEVANFYEVDEIRLSQILGNLITNAIKFTDFGHVDIAIEKVKTDGQQDKLSFKVTDTGSGIEASFLEDIFDSFSQPKSITTRKQGGSGLGLAIVKKLVNLHGNVVQVSSTVGKGSVFYFDLEFKRCESPVKPAATFTDQLKDKTVLLAEDNLINAMLISKLLSNWKMTTEHARNGIEAVAKSKTKTFDFILMDIHMPEMDGFEATKHIRKQKAYNIKTPIFAITADITAEYMDEYTPYFNGFLHKPIQIDKLYEALVNVL